MSNNKRLATIASFLATSIGVIWYVIFSGRAKYAEAINGTLTINEIIFYKIIPILFIILGIGLIIYLYLETGFKSRFSSSSETRIIDKQLQSQFINMEKKLVNMVKNIGNREHRPEEINELIDNAIGKNINQKILDSFEKKYSASAIEEINWNRIEEYSDSLEYNLTKYIQKLSRNASINLIIGTLTTIVAVGILGFLIFEKDVDFASSLDILGHYLPRISISIFIEIFSFFFLKLYRGNLNDVKYFENERTNINSKLLALKTAYLMNNEDAIKLAMENLINTERNFKLKKDESTVELEKTKVSSAQETKWMELFNTMWRAKS